ELQRLVISTQTVLDLEEVRELTNLTDLLLWPSELDGRFDMLRGLAYLQVLGVGTLANDPDYETFAVLSNLTRLYCYVQRPPALELLGRISGLTALYLDSLPEKEFTLDAVARMLPQITALALYGCPYIDDLAPVTDMRLTELILHDSTVRDLMPLASCRSLETLHLAGSRIHRLDALATHGMLRYLNLADTAEVELGAPPAAPASRLTRGRATQK